MLVRKSSLISIVAIYTTIAVTMPYEWRIGSINSFFSIPVASIIVFTLYLCCGKYSNIMLMYMLYNITIIGSTLFNEINIEDQIHLSLTGIALVASFELINRYASKRQFKIYVSYFVLLVVINSIQTLYYGTTRDSKGYLCIFGNKNWYLYRILPALFLMVFLSVKYGEKIRSRKLFVVWTLALISVIVAGSSAGTLVLGVWLLYVLLVPIVKRIKQNEGFDNYIVYIILTVFIFFVIIIWNAPEIFEPIIVDLLGKDLTFTTRTRIWARALELIKEKPIWGYGAVPSEMMVSMFYGVPDFTTVHNQYLGELFKGGVILLTVFIMMIVMSFRKMAKYKKGEGNKILTFGLFCVLIWWMMESITSMYIILTLFTCYHLSDNCRKR